MHNVNRADRERNYWNETYGTTSSEHGKYLWTEKLSSDSHIRNRFRSLVAKFRGKYVLSLGGGVDHLAISLARAGNRVLSVDLSATAVTETIGLAKNLGVEDNVDTKICRAEDLVLPEEPFDAVICCRSLHHMDVTAVVRYIHGCLSPGGVFLAEEPVCVSRTLRWIHEVLPFHPESPRTVDERELNENDMSLISDTFQHMELRYFDMLARESLAYFLIKLRMKKLLQHLGKLDEALMNYYIPKLKSLSSYVIIRGEKKQ